MLNRAMESYRGVRRRTRKQIKHISTLTDIRRQWGMFYKLNGNIFVPLRHGVGNKLMQYCIGRALAEATGMAMEVSDERSKHDSGQGDQYQGMIEYLQMCPYVEGERSRGIPVILRPDCENIFEISGRRPVVVYGQFFRYEYLREYKELVKGSWLKLDRNRLPIVHPENACVHMRMGDFCRIGRNLNERYYRRAIESMDWDDLVIVTDEPLNDIVQKIRIRFGATVVSNRSWIDDFCFIAAHKRIAISESTFSWWAAWLSEAEHVVSPGPNLDPEVFGGYWNQNLKKRNPYVDDESRYELLN